MDVLYTLLTHKRLSPMKKQTQYLITLLLVSVFLAACNSAVVKKESENILSITVESASGSIRPMYRTSRLLQIKNDLSTYFIVRDYQDKVTKEHKGKITQAQFDDLVKPLKKVNLARIKSFKLPHPRVGGGHSVVTIQTDKGKYSYTNSDRYDYPQVIGELSGKIRKL